MWYVGNAQKKSEREHELRGRFEHNLKEVVDKFQGHNLYLKNLDDNIGDEELRELFSEFGTITSCKIMRDPNGVSRGSEFVAFSTAEEAALALTEMNTKIVGSKPLYVAVAQCKEERRARLQMLWLLLWLLLCQCILGVLQDWVNIYFTAKPLQLLFPYRCYGCSCGSSFANVSFGWSKTGSTYTLRPSPSSYYSPTDYSRGSGFAAFSTAEEAARALTEMNTKLLPMWTLLIFSLLR